MLFRGLFIASNPNTDYYVEWLGTGIRLDIQDLRTHPPLFMWQPPTWNVIVYEYGLSTWPRERRSVKLYLKTFMF
jgi:hypothetical protein